MQRITLPSVLPVGGCAPDRPPRSEPPPTGSSAGPYHAPPHTPAPLYCPSKGLRPARRRAGPLLDRASESRCRRGGAFPPRWVVGLSCRFAAGGVLWSFGFSRFGRFGCPCCASFRGWLAGFVSGCGSAAVASRGRPGRGVSPRGPSLGLCGVAGRWPRRVVVWVVVGPRCLGGRVVFRGGSSRCRRVVGGPGRPVPGRSSPGRSASGIMGGSAPQSPPTNKYRNGGFATVHRSDHTNKGSVQKQLFSHDHYPKTRLTAETAWGPIFPSPNLASRLRQLRTALGSPPWFLPPNPYLPRPPSDNEREHYFYLGGRNPSPRAGPPPLSGEPTQAIHPFPLPFDSSQLSEHGPSAHNQLNLHKTKTAPPGPESSVDPSKVRWQACFLAVGPRLPAVRTLPDR